MSNTGMSEKIHDSTHGFLVLGFTGPLSSGCTTSAKFFELEINKYIKVNISTLEAVERQIPRLYKALYDLKTKFKALNEDDIFRSASDNTGVETKHQLESHNSKKILAEIKRLNNRLKARLDLRETLEVLHHYQDNNFKYISITDVLIKIVVESLLANSVPEERDGLSILLSIELKPPIPKVRIDKLKTAIEERDFSKLKEGGFEEYEKYIQYISTFKKELKAAYEDNLDGLGNLLQDLGDNVRRCGNPLDYKTDFSDEKTLSILAEEANDLIKFYRARERGKSELFTQFVVEAFRNPHEVEYFRNRYYEFFLFSIFSQPNIRKSRGNYNPSRDKRDQGSKIEDHEFYKQNVGECVHLSDIAINNDISDSLLKKIEFFKNNGKEVPDRLKVACFSHLKQFLAKHLALIKRPGCIPPTKDETFMHMAYSLSVQSSCISRQVGAVIVNNDDFVIGTGWNEVTDGQVGCGLRKCKDLNMSNEIFPVAPVDKYKNFAAFCKESGLSGSHNFCYKDLYSKFVINEKVTDDDFKKQYKEWQGVTKIDDIQSKELFKLLKGSFTIKRLEYCRALHAEENAILQTAVMGGVGVHGSTIYTTTFPCELCTKKIFRAGIKRVVYTEPYPGSISQDVFFKDGAQTIEQHQFEGVKSHSYYRLFKANVNKKEFQKQAFNQPSDAPGLMGLPASPKVEDRDKAEGKGPFKKAAHRLREEPNNGN